MIDSTYFFHCGTIAFSVGLSSLGVGIGEGLTSLSALEALSIQPSAHNDIARTSMLGMALIETSAVIGLTIAFILLFPFGNVPHLEYTHYAELGIAFAIAISGTVVGVASSFPSREACFAIARQPFFAQKIQSIMLLTQSLMQTPVIFAFMVALFIKTQMLHVTSSVDSIRLIASGLCIGLASIGPAIGLGVFSKAACKSVGINREAYSQILSFTLMSEALIESPLIFAFLVSIMLTQITSASPVNYLESIIFISSALCMGMGTLGTSIASGKVAAEACNQIGLNPKNYSALLKTSMFGQILIETCSIYALVISLSLLLIR